ncbi:uncharacterized protein LOC135383046 isoform X1 [Ornithodoros turicata]|uniref:uncharacterized protein LOC135383046 isoform X1 n=1 Tax=Ornithodoros turicata TaxID=34597 RepID=UPI003139C7C0
MDAASQKIINSVQIQVGESEDIRSSSHMEKAGFIRCLDEVKCKGITVASITTDRHPSVRKHMRENEPTIVHGFDIWHVVKGMKKKLEAAANSRACAALKPWVQHICNHLYWCSGNSEGNTEFLLSMWRSLTRHVINIHDSHDGPYNRCLHGDLGDRRPWLQPGTVVYIKLCKIVLDKRLLKDIEQLSTVGQTSGLESFHSLLLKFAPKSTAYTPKVMRARTQIAILHFNENADRPLARRKDGGLMYRRKLVKTKKGTEVVSTMKTKATHRYVDHLLREAMTTCQDLSYSEMVAACKSPEPAPMTAQYERQPKEVLIARRMLRFPTE